ncbi:MAG: rhodanese-like domain-containing protein [Pontiellaceae bacterium]|nr:rhodanese-like domain-containing protein [Pontiellaceae bacterium]MBN2785201.1 rhodanese-like domain-containing protein [Pontiellaceae bacterium]
MSLLGNLLFRGGADKGTDIPALIKDGALVIDTRTAGEYAGGHIEGAVNIPYDIIRNVICKHAKDKSKSIIVYCQSGSRSGMAKRALEQAGYTNVVNGGGLHHMQHALQP